MGFSWIVHQWSKTGINPIDNNLITVDCGKPTDGYPIENIFNWNDMNRTIIQGKSLLNITFTFKDPVSIYKYMLQVPEKVRYLKGWKIEVSYDKSNFTTVDEKDVDFCDGHLNNYYNDCNETTTKSFSIPLSTVYSIRLSMTKPDSSSTYRMEFSGVDFYVAPPNYLLLKTYCSVHNLLHLNLIASTYILLY